MWAAHFIGSLLDARPILLLTAVLGGFLLVPSNGGSNSMACSYACISLAGPRAHLLARASSAGEPEGQLAQVSVTMMPACGPTTIIIRSLATTSHLGAPNLVTTSPLGGRVPPPETQPKAGLLVAPQHPLPSSRPPPPFLWFPPTILFLPAPP